MPQSFLALQFSDIEELRDTLYYDLQPVRKTTRCDRLYSLRKQMINATMSVETERPVQAVHLSAHWVALSNRHSEAANVVYSLASSLHSDLPHLVTAVFRFSERSFSIQLHTGARQFDGNSSGVYTSAFLTSDYYGRNVETEDFTKKV